MLSPDASALFFTRCFSVDREDAFCHLLSSNRIRDGWTKPELIGELRGNFNVMHPSFSNDGRLLFFASDASGGLGGSDLYFCVRGEEGWSAPQNLGQRINGEGDEVFPHLHKDTLFFSSTSHPGMGGLDIFYSYFNEVGQWVKPINLKTPINSGADDFGIWVDTLNPTNDVKLRGFFSSSRPGGKGRDDIYGFVTYYPEEKKSEEDLIEIRERANQIRKTLGDGGRL